MPEVDRRKRCYRTPAARSLLYCDRAMLVRERHAIIDRGKCPEDRSDEGEPFDFQNPAFEWRNSQSRGFDRKT